VFGFEGAVVAYLLDAPVDLIDSAVFQDCG
jgi:hypothetical protein